MVLEESEWGSVRPVAIVPDAIPIVSLKAVDRPDPDEAEGIPHHARGDIAREQAIFI